jgi:hypothetical protein
VGVQAVGTDAVTGALNSTVGTAGNVAGSAMGSANGAAGATGSASGAANAGLGSLAAAGSAAANAAGAISVSPGMIVRDTAGRAIGTVGQVRATANGAADTVMVEVGDQVAALPADNFSVSGDALVSAMSRGEVRGQAD